MARNVLSIGLVCALMGLMSGTAHAATVDVRFESSGQLVLVARPVPPGMTPVEAAVGALVAGPTADERATGLSSWIPAGTKVVALDAAGDSVAVDLSGDVLNGLDEAVLERIFTQFKATLGDFPSITTVRLTSQGQLLASFLPPAISQGPPPSAYKRMAIAGLSGRNVTIGPSHGKYWVGWWGWQRSDPCGFGEAVLEDTNSIRLCQFLYQYLAQDGATVHVARELNESNCCNSDTGDPWWKMCAESWLHASGLPCSVWASYSGNCGADTATSRSSDDIRARPLFADYRGSDIYIACHTNAGGGGTANGTETYRDTAMEHPAHEANSYTLASNVQSSVISAIRELYDGAWSDRGVKDSAGGFGEIRIPDRPAILIELAFHDNCSRDASYLTDDFFRSAAEWGLYRGVCQYFGTSPTWDRYSDEYVADTIPTTMLANQTYTVSVTFRNRGVLWRTAREFRLGAVGDSDPFTSTTRFNIVGDVRPGNTYTFSFSLTAPATAGTYTTDWRMVRDGVAWFGATVSRPVSVIGGMGACGGSDNNRGTTIGNYSVDWQSNPTSASGWGTNTCTGSIAEWRTWGVPITGQSCTVYDRNCYWNSAQSWSGRGHFNTDVQVTCSGTALAKYVLLNAANGDTGTQPTLNQCPLNGWYNILNSDWTDLSTNGWRTNPNIADAGSGCNATCGYPILSAAGLHMYGARWHYVNDWVCLGGYSSSAVSTTHGFDEASAYLYPAIDTTHGNVIGPALFNGKVPGRVTTGDCNNANSLNFKGNANAYGGGDSMDSYGFAWAYAPGGGGPKFLIGSDDGNRVWVNGSLVNDNNASRGLTRDEDETGSIGMSAGWNRILFKVHNGSGGFEGAVSLRNGGDRRWNEPSVNVFDLGGYYSYGIGFEQDGWYPCIDVSTFYGGSDPQPGGDYYGNSTTVTAGGTATGNGPIPFWKVMHYEWGYSLSGDTSYTDVSSSGTTWSNTTTGVTGHRRFHFFAVSKSGRTSFQTSGVSGGGTWADGGPGNYADVFIDNLAPQDPSFASVAATGPNQIALSWSIPNDQGVGSSAGATEYASEGGDNAYRRGNVGVNVRRGGTGIYGWGTNTSVNDGGLTPNTAYTYDIAARDNTGGGRGAWNTTTSYVSSTTRYTLAGPPSVGNNVTCDKATSTPYPPATTFQFSNPAGFGAGTHGGSAYKVSKFKYAWDTNATHTWSGSENDWNSGTLAFSPSAAGDYYLHLQSFNGDNLSTATTLDYGPFQVAPTCTGPAITGQPQTQTICVHDQATLTVTATGDPAPTYQWRLNGDNIPDATNATYQTNVAGSYDCVVSNACGNVNSDSATVTVTPDTDNDGVCDDLDGCPSDPNKTAPGLCGCGNPDTDTDGDGTPDCNDQCPNDPNKIAPGICGCGTPDTDTDQDGTPDCHDNCPNDPAKTQPGVCGCGIPDTDSDGDGTPNCNDGCPADPLKIAPGACGCGHPETGDTDGDGVADCVDNCPTVPNPGQQDSNGNGIGDACEGSPPVITAATSDKVHGAVGTFTIDVLATGAVECRKDGSAQIVVTFNEGIQLVGPTPVVVSMGSVSSLTISGGSNEVLTIAMSGGTDATPLTVTFPGVADAVNASKLCTGSLCFGLLVGDVNSDLTVNIFDLVKVRNELNLAVTGTNFRTDVNYDGAINIFDLVTLRNNLNKSVSACP